MRFFFANRTQLMQNLSLFSNTCHSYVHVQLSVTLAIYLISRSRSLICNVASHPVIILPSRFSTTWPTYPDDIPISRCYWPLLLAQTWLSRANLISQWYRQDISTSIRPSSIETRILSWPCWVIYRYRIELQVHILTSTHGLGRNVRIAHVAWYCSWKFYFQRMTPIR